jgi:hypothetical protein
VGFGVEDGEQAVEADGFDGVLVEAGFEGAAAVGFLAIAGQRNQRGDLPVMYGYEPARDSRPSPTSTRLEFDHGKWTAVRDDTLE